MYKKNLSDILSGSTCESLSHAWETAEAARDFAPLPTGVYVARITSGELTNSRTKGTPSYKLTFEVLEGDHVGRRLWHDIFLTKAAMPMAKRDLAKLSVTKLEQLEKPMPQGIRCEVHLKLRQTDDRAEYNRVTSFKVIGIDKPEADPYAPVAATNENGGDV